MGSEAGVRQPGDPDGIRDVQKLLAAGSTPWALVVDGRGSGSSYTALIRCPYKCGGEGVHEVDVEGLLHADTFDSPCGSVVLFDDAGFLCGLRPAVWCNSWA